MFEQFFISVLERMYGQKLASLQSVSGVLPERTIRSWMDGTSKPAPERLERIRLANKAWLRQRLSDLGWPDDLRDARLTALEDNTGLLSHLIHSLDERPDTPHPETLALARRIDTLSDDLAERRNANDIARYVRLLNTEWLTDWHFYNPEDELAPAAQRARTKGANLWDDLKMPTAVLLLNLSLQVLATLDHEFGAWYLPTMAPAPVFHGLVAVRQVGMDGAVPRRDALRLPTRRLLDMLACMRYYRKRGRWPSAPPTMNEVSAWTAIPAGTLAKWRLGRAFTLHQFYPLWNAMFDRIPVSKRPAEPVALLFAATLLTRLLVRGSREQKNLSVCLGAGDYYLTWWERQRLAVEASLPGARSGKEVWMPNLL